MGYLHIDNLYKNNKILTNFKHTGSRIIAKHKRAEFSETKTPREVDVNKLNLILGAGAIADEWVTEMRLAHVMDKVLGPQTPEMKHTGDIVRGMIEDVQREASGEILDFTPEINRAIGTRAAKLFKALISQVKI